MACFSTVARSARANLATSGRHPYNEQGFKGPVLDPSDTSRFLVMTYGDSNTDGPDRGGWPERLQELLRARNPASDVLNAGVVGYSSYQGLLRFQQEASRFKPDVIIISFGWNDVAATNSAPDSSFVPPGPVRTRVQRTLLQFKSYRVLLNVLRDDPTTGTLRPRVSRQEYLLNIKAFLDTARRFGTRVAIATRPHRESPAALRALAPDWRAQVPDYNDDLRLLSKRHNDLLLIDVQKYFDGELEDFIDECHFNPQGHSRMAERILTSLTNAQWLEGAAPTEM